MQRICSLSPFLSDKRADNCQDPPQSIEITSFPGFDRSISDKSIAEYNIRARIYRNRRIADILMGSPLSRSELARALGYKSISAKLTRTIDSMISDRTLAEVVIAGKVKLCVSGKSHS